MGRKVVGNGWVDPNGSRVALDSLPISFPEIVVTPNATYSSNWHFSFLGAKLW
jgi:hypothetical protein